MRNQESVLEGEFLKDFNASYYNAAFPIGESSRYEAEALANLELRREQVHAVLQDEQRIQLNERVAKGYLSKLKDAVNVYEQSVAGLFTALVEN